MDTKRDLYIAKTFAGLEPLLEKELSEVGAEEVTVLRRAVSFTGDRQILYRANIWCRTALSILKQVHSFSFEDKDGFYEQMYQYDWPGLFDKEKTFTIIPVAYNNEVFNNTMYLALLSKDAIADCFTARYGSRPDVDNTGANIRINVHVLNKQCSISLDSSGEALFKRGYRMAAGPAPINEILAAGLIMLSEWDKTSPFVDPMCGSGTFSIEAAMMSANMAPGASRKSFGFSHWPDFDAELLKLEQEDARSKETKVQADIIASDFKGFMLDHTRKNVMNAGFMGSIKIQKNDFFTYRPPYQKGWVILNPPYGQRMQHSEIDKLHQDIGEALKHRYTGFRAGIITSEIAAMRHIGLKPSSKTQLYNGPLQCVFNVYDLFAGKRKEKTNFREQDTEEETTHKGASEGGSGRTERKDWKKEGEKPRSWKKEDRTGRTERKDWKREGERTPDWKKEDRTGRTERKEWKRDGDRTPDWKKEDGTGRTERKDWKRDSDRTPGWKKEGGTGRTERKDWKRDGERTPDWKKEGGTGRTERKDWKREGERTPGWKKEEGTGRTERKEWKRDGERTPGWKKEEGTGRTERKEWKRDGERTPGWKKEGGTGRTERKDWKRDGEKPRSWKTEDGKAPGRRVEDGRKREDGKRWKTDDRPASRRSGARRPGSRDSRKHI